ncbi:MAG TPA: hypothetical protein VEC99_06815, partial [Clostridia bacterium]|nr:hypothetical protein [Clostridia bacterium]
PSPRHCSMKVILHDPLGGLYFRSLDWWTNHASEAFDFENVDDALELAAGIGLKHCEVILSSDIFEWVHSSFWPGTKVTS